MVKGDNRATASAIAEQTGIISVLANILPAGKSDEVTRLRADGKVEFMVGDDMRDAPALA